MVGYIVLKTISAWPNVHCVHFGEKDNICFNMGPSTKDVGNFEPDF
jgi:hypothetical protein